jgi:predicted ArsR family transcriptional regulator
MTTMPKEVVPTPGPPATAVAAGRVVSSALRLAVIHELRHGPNSARGLARHLELNEATVADNLKALAAEGVIAPVEPERDRPAAGRAPFLYELNTSRRDELLSALVHYLGSGDAPRGRRAD